MIKLIRSTIFAFLSWMMINLMYMIVCYPQLLMKEAVLVKENNIPLTIRVEVEVKNN